MQEDGEGTESAECGSRNFQEHESQSVVSYARGMWPALADAVEQDLPTAKSRRRVDGQCSRHSGCIGSTRASEYRTCTGVCLGTKRSSHSCSRSGKETEGKTSRNVHGCIRVPGGCGAVKSEGIPTQPAFLTAGRDASSQRAQQGAPTRESNLGRLGPQSVETARECPLEGSGKVGVVEHSRLPEKEGERGDFLQFFVSKVAISTSRYNNKFGPN